MTAVKLTRMDKLPSLPPVGARCLYQNDALKLRGWGVLAEPRDDIDGSEMPILIPWVGTLEGPRNEGQVALDRLVPGIGVFPSKDRYMVVPRILLWVEA